MAAAAVAAAAEVAAVSVRFSSAISCIGSVSPRSCKKRTPSKFLVSCRFSRCSCFSARTAFVRSCGGRPGQHPARRLLQLRQLRPTRPAARRCPRCLRLWRLRRCCWRRRTSQRRRRRRTRGCCRAAERPCGTGLLLGGAADGWGGGCGRPDGLIVAAVFEGCHRRPSHSHFGCRGHRAKKTGSNCTPTLSFTSATWQNTGRPRTTTFTGADHAVALPSAACLEPQPRAHPLKSCSAAAWRAPQGAPSC